MRVNLAKRQLLDSAQFRGFKTSFIRCYIWRRQILKKYGHLKTLTVPALFSPRETCKVLLGMNLLFSTSPFLFATDPQERVL